MRDDTKHATEVERVTRKLVLASSEAEADTHLTGKEAFADTNTNEEIEIINIGSNRICIREQRRRWRSAKNPAMPFSKWAMWSSLT